MAVQRLKNLKRRLLSKGATHAQMYQDRIEDMVTQGTAKKMDATDHAYQGNVYYIPNLEVMKPDSASTPMWIVFNSSSSYMGEKLNNYWAKGPCVLNDML